MTQPIRLSSDTETRPSAAMREAIAAAVVGDEQKGKDPTVNELQERVAELLGTERALWFPGGTMCNFVALKVHTDPADALLADWMSHVVRAESGGLAFSSGLILETIPTERGIFDISQLRSALERLGTVPPPYGPRPRLLCVEQTHNIAGGTVWPEEQLRDVADFAHERGMAVHMDGARLLNASVAAGVSPAVFTRAVDSVWIDFTKGLGAPVGAVLAGSERFIDEARRYKHVFGGAMRQAGIVAAACLYALDHNVERLAEDHTHAQALAAGLTTMPGIAVRNPEPETNMVYFDASSTGATNSAFVEVLGARGVEVSEVYGGIRAVTHLDISAEDIHRTLAVVAKSAAEIAELTTPPEHD